MGDDLARGDGEAGERRRWIARDEVMAILRALLLAAVALAIGALVASQVDGPGAPPRPAMAP